MENSMLPLPEYKEENGNVYLSLRNKISEHSKTIHDKVVLKIQNKSSSFNQTQRKILGYLFRNQKSIKEDLANFCNTHINTISHHLNYFIEEGIITRLSEKQRDPNALFTLKKH
ncbi:hypothetical protein INR75_20075 [Zunongwangia sp. SCSIO 43204]|uniref:hypothetical protein n=1 Tax=unclassified Zunongwangia TaxID=2632541 RepID=UPI001CA866D5|nr:hypothetical protein [Zunongwangia sp. SCSIO 43204]UAB84419.1 hypothetical protein INR75_20075 [Zunongwangia sp. SCSIO 43204]